LTNFFEEINSPEYTDFFLPHPFNAENAGYVCSHRGRDLYYAILLNGAEIIGYGMLRGWDEGYEIPAVGLCLLKKYQGIGLGGTFLNFLETVATLNGCKKLMLKVKKTNAIARTLYESRRYILQEYNKEFMIGFKSLIQES
jgi:GNAT superfamily N-acetyltransferase